MLCIRLRGNKYSTKVAANLITPGYEASLIHGSNSILCAIEVAAVYVPALLAIFKHYYLLGLRVIPTIYLVEDTGELIL